MELASEHGFDFSRGALEESFTGKEGGWSEEELIENGVESQWARKVMIMDWAPIGYSR